MFILRLIATTLLIMFAFPALGLMGFDGGVLGGLGAAVLTAVMSFVVVLVSLPVLATFGVGAILAGGAAGGAVGARVVSFGLHTAINTGTLYLVAWMLAGVSLVGFWPTVGAAAILGLAQVILTPRSDSSN